MKNKSLKIFTSIMIIAMLIISAMPFASAATLIDESRKVSITLNCNKPGYTFDVYKIANLESNSENPYETKYISLVPSISEAVLLGSTANILNNLDKLSEMPSTAPVVGTFTSSAALTSKTISNLTQGIYYVKAVNYPAGVKSVTNSIVTLPYYNNGWIYSYPAINLAAKVADGTPTTHKTITNSTKNNENFSDVSLGDTVNFEIRSTTAGSTSMKLKSYLVTDIMSAGLTLNKDSFNVSLLKNDGTKITDLESSEYTVNITSEGAGKNTKFNVSLTNSYLQGNEFYSSDVVYTAVTYSAVLNKYAVVGTAGNPNTEGKLEFSNKNGVKSEVQGNTVYVYTYAAMTNKLNPQGKKLAGAEFKIFAKETDAQAQKNELAKGTSDSEGKVLYYNSKNEEMRLASGTYYIVETKAPTGYSLYGKIISININAEYGETLVNNTYVTNSPENGYAVVDVTDHKLVVPKTGGAGNMLFYIGGTVFFATAVIVFLAAKKRKINN